VVSLMPPRIVSELGLRRFGYRVSILEPDYWALPDGSALTLWEDAGRTAEEIATPTDRIGVSDINCRTPIIVVALPG